MPAPERGLGAAVLLLAVHAVSIDPAALQALGEYARGCDPWGTTGFWSRFSVYLEDDPVRNVDATLLIAGDRYVLLLCGSVITGRVHVSEGDPGTVVFGRDPGPSPGWIDDPGGEQEFEFRVSAGGRVLGLFCRDPEGNRIRELFERKDPSAVLQGMAEPGLGRFLEACLAVIEGEQVSSDPSAAPREEETFTPPTGSH